MKKVFSISMTFALLVAGIVMPGCNKNDQNNPEEPNKVQTYKMTINASKGADNSDPANGPKKILGLDPSGNTISAAWEIGNEVSVYKVVGSTYTKIDGVLYAQKAGAETTLSGELTGEINPGDMLELVTGGDGNQYPLDYTRQDGTLEGISSTADYAIARVTVASIAEGYITTNEDADFANQQAIVKFILQNENGDPLYYAYPLKIRGNGRIARVNPTEDESYRITWMSGEYPYYVSGPTNEFYFAYYNNYSEGSWQQQINDYKLTAVVGGYEYICEKAGPLVFEAGKFYQITVTMIQNNNDDNDDNDDDDIIIIGW